MLRRHGGISLADICALLEEEYGKGQDHKKIKEKLMRLKKNGLVLFDGKKWDLGHDPEPDDVLALVQKKEAGITLTALSKKLGCLNEKERKLFSAYFFILSRTTKSVSITTATALCQAFQPKPSCATWTSWAEPS